MEPLNAEKNGGTKPFKLEGHTLPGINQKLDTNPENVDELGLPGTSALKSYSVKKGPHKHPHKKDPSATKQKEKYYYPLEGTVGEGSESHFFSKQKPSGKSKTIEYTKVPDITAGGDEGYFKSGKGGKVKKISKKKYERQIARKKKSHKLNT